VYILLNIKITVVATQLLL